MKEQFVARARVIHRLFVAATFVLTLGGCGLESPQAPSWDTTLTIPLINRTYTSAELFEKLASDNIKIDENGNSSLNIQRDLDTITIESILALDPITADFSKQIGRIKIESPSDQQQNLEFAELMPFSLGLVPDTGITTTTSFGQASSFSEATIDEASITLRAVNNTGFDLDSLTGRLVNPQTGVTLATLVVPGGLADGQQYSHQYSLDGRVVGSQLDFEVYFHTEGGPALSLADRSIEFVIDYSDDIYVSSVTGKLDAFGKDYTEQVDIPDDVQVQSAILADGQLHLALQNNLQIATDLQIVLPEVTHNETPLQLDFSVPAGGSANQNVDLAGWNVVPANRQLLVELHAAVPNSGGYVQIDANDQFSIDFTLDGIALESASAIVPQTELEISGVDVDVEIPNGFDNLSLDLVELTVNVSNYTELGGEVDVLLEASNGKSLHVYGTVEGRGENTASINQIYSNQLADLLTPLPDQISVSGVARVGDGVSVIELNSSDYFSAKASISAPMAFKITEAEVEGDQNSLEVDDDLADAVDRLHTGTFKSTITNHLPLGAQMRLYIGTDSTTLFDSPVTVIGPLSFTSGSIDGNGNVSDESSTNSEVVLTEEDLQVFQNKNLFVAPVLDLAGSNGQTVRIRAADYFTVNGVIELKARVGGEK